MSPLWNITAKYDDCVAHVPFMTETSRLSLPADVMQVSSPGLAALSSVANCLDNKKWLPPTLKAEEKALLAVDRVTKVCC